MIMKKILFLAATAAIALSSCSSDEILEKNGPQENEKQTPVSFSGYVARGTRATTLTINDNLKTGGFGVYAYDQGTDKVEVYTNSYITPNFFDNQKVAYNTATSEWEYAPVKYWPNTEGAKVSFYAYAPYIAGLNAGNDTPPANPELILKGENNGPALKYSMPTDLTQGIDLCYGVLDGTTKAPVNRLRPSINDKISIVFKHALARYSFNVQVFNDMLTDGDAHGTPADGGSLAAGTTIKVNSLKLVGNMATDGVLKLYDGSWDAQVATTTSYELNSGFSPAVTNGITTNSAATEIPLFAAANDYVLLIPGSKFKVQITYTVETTDANLLNGKSETVNVVTSEDYYTAVAGVATDFHLNLGMTTVKFTASVSDWNTTPVIEEVDLPSNISAAAAAADYKYDDFTPTGKTTVSGNTVTTTYASTAEATANMLADLARFLGALYRAGGVTAIQWNDGTTDNTYAWDPAAAGNLLGSNWWNATTSKTLVSELTTWYASNPTATQITIKCDGEDLVLKFATL